MSLGSFLAGAGHIGEGIEKYQTESELRRLQREQAAATRAEMARQEVARQRIAELPPVEIPQGGLRLGAPMPLAEGEYPTIVPVEGGADIGVAGGAAEPTGAAPAGVKPPAAPKYVQKTTKGRDIPQYSPKAPNVITGAAENSWLGAEYGFERIDPNASDYEQGVIKNRNKAKLNKIVFEMGAKADEDVSLLKPQMFMPQDKKKAEQLAQKAKSWYANPGQGGARDYFSKFPEMIAVAKANPVAFYQTMANYTASTAARVKAGVKTAGKAAPTAATVEQPFIAAPARARLEAISTAIAEIPQNDPYRRVLGLEGGFNKRNGTFLTSPAGAVGPAQLMPGTAPEAMELAGFSRNDKRWRTDPRINIMAGRAYYNMLLDRYNGDQVKAAAAYNTGPGNLDKAVRKAAKSGLSWVDHLPADETRKYVRDFVADTGRAVQFAGGAPLQTGEGGGTAQVSGAPQQEIPRLSASDFYLANDAAIGQDTQIALRNRQELANLANIYKSVGMADEYLNLRFKLLESDSNLLYLQAMQGIQELSVLRDPRRLEAVYSQYIGTPVRFQPRRDGRYNVMVNGRVVQQGVDPAELVNAVRTGVDKQYAADRATLSAKISEEGYKSTLKRQEKADEVALQAAKEIQTELRKGKNALAVETAKQAGGKLVTADGKLYLQKGEKLYAISPGGEQVPGAEEGVLTAPTAKRVLGVGVG